MGKELNKIDAIILIGFFLLALWVWAMPAVSTPALFGEGDAYWHYGQSDYIVEYNQVDSKLPYAYINKYFLWNKELGPLAREYPPTNHVNYANMIYLGGHKFVPVGLFKAITSFIAFLGIFLFCRCLFSQIIAIIASFGVMFSHRAFSIYLFGQHPTTISIIFIPLILYLAYRIIENIKQEEDFTKYLVILVLMLCIQYLLHLQGLAMTFFFLIPIALLFIIKMFMEKKIGVLSKLFTKKNLITYAILIFVIAALTLPFFSTYFGALDKSVASPSDNVLTRLFEWQINPDNVAGAYPAHSVLFENEFTYMFIPFMIIGLLLMLLKFKKDNYLFLWGSLIGLYVFLHSDLLGAGFMRIIRGLMVEGYILWILVALGVSVLISFISQFSKVFLKKNSIFLKYALVLGFVVWMYISLATPMAENGKGAYPAIMRVNSDNLEAIEWIKDNLPMDASIFVKNDHVPWRNNRYKYIRTMAHRVAYITDNITASTEEWTEKIENANEDYGTDYAIPDHRYLLIDYSDYVQLTRDPNFKNLIAAFNQYEQYYFPDEKPVYKRRNIVIYNITGKEIV